METLLKIREAINFLTSATKEGSNATEKSVQEWMKYLEAMAWELNMESSEDDLSDIKFPKGYFKEFTPEAKLFLIVSGIRSLQRVVNGQDEAVV